MVPVAANQQAEILAVKSGRAISSANEEKLRAALSSLNEVLDGIDSDNSASDEDKADDSKTGERPDDKKLDPDEGKDAEAEKAERLNVIKSARELVTGGKDNKETK